VQIYPVKNSHIFLIDTPGFDDPQRSDPDILQSIASCLADLYEGLIFAGAEISLSGITYIHAIDEPRVTGAMMKNLTMLQHIVGEGNMEHLVLATSKWGVEDAKVAEDRESELISNATYWKGLLAAGATTKRYEDSQRSALDIINQATRGGMFVPQLTREYVIEGIELCQTASGRAIDRDLAKAQDQHEAELATLRGEHDEAREARSADAAAELRLLTLQTEAKLRVMDDEMDQLRTTRGKAQKQADESELMVSHPGSADSTTQREEVRRARVKRASRWFGRFVAMGAAITMSVLTRGAMAPFGVGLMIQAEYFFQKDKEQELQRKSMRLNDNDVHG